MAIINTIEVFNARRTFIALINTHTRFSYYILLHNILNDGWILKSAYKFSFNL